MSSSASASAAVDRSPPHPYNSSSSTPSGRMGSLSINTSVRQHQQHQQQQQQHQQQSSQQKPAQTASASSVSGRYYSGSYSQHHLSAHHSHLSHHHHHHHHSQHHPDIHGPLSAGVVENMSHRSFASYPYSRESSGHSSHYPLFHAPAPPAPPAASSSSTSSSRTADNNSTAATSTLPSSQPHQQLTVSDILDRYRDANPDLLMTVLNAKSKEDERRAEEERYRVEQIRLQTKKVELELEVEKRKAISAAANQAPPPRAYNASDYGQAASATSYYPPAPVSAPPSSTTNNASGYHYGTSSEASSHTHHSSHPHHSHGHHSSTHYASDTQDRSPPSKHQSSSSQHHHLHHHHARPPPGLKINTAVRQYPKPNSAQCLPPSPHHASAPGSVASSATNGSSKTTGVTLQRQYNLSGITSSSAQSSPVAVIDYQSHIPPPLTPHDEPNSPTVVLSPTQPHSLKRKQTTHDAVMDAVRAKALRNQQQQQQQQAHKKLATGEDYPQPLSASASGPGNSRRKINQTTYPGSRLADTKRGSKDASTSNGITNGTANGLTAKSSDGQARTADSSTRSGVEEGSHQQQTVASPSSNSPPSSQGASPPPPPPPPPRPVGAATSTPTAANETPRAGSRSPLLTSTSQSQPVTATKDVAPHLVPVKSEERSMDKQAMLGGMERES